VGHRPDAVPPAGWTAVSVRAAGLNHHDVWSLKGDGLPADRLPMILGCDGAGIDADGNEVIVHAVIPTDGWTGDESLDRRRMLLSELHEGTLAEQVACRRETSCQSHRVCRGRRPPACPPPG
jgi:NADPH:quinone reductase-like Zn-dependent oxidoreductase